MGKRRQRDQQPTRGEPPLFPSVEDLLQHEVTTLARMATIGGWPPFLQTWRQEVLAASKSASNKGRLDIHLRFTAKEPRAGANDPPHSVELGALIIPGNPPLVTYFFAIGLKGNDGQYHGLRKFHFDLSPTKSSTEPKPIIHMQLPGRMCSALVKAGYHEDAFDFLNPKLDKPRILCLPTSVAILAHTALLEYVSADERIARFIRSQAWLASVILSERYVLKTFLDHSLTWLGKIANKKYSLVSYLYRYPTD